jgi:predicted ATPase
MCRSSCCRRLQGAELLYEVRLFPELEYTFKHALTHEVAYGGLLQERRRALHALVVEAMEQIYADRRDEQVERLAHHAVRGEMHEKAVHYLRQAGLKAARRSALQEACVWFEQALGAVQALREDRASLEDAFEIRLELRPVPVQLGEVRRALEYLHEAGALAERLDDNRKRGRVGVHDEHPLAVR